MAWAEAPGYATEAIFSLAQNRLHKSSASSQLLLWSCSWVRLNFKPIFRAENTPSMMLFRTENTASMAEFRCVTFIYDGSGDQSWSEKFPAPPLTLTTNQKDIKARQYYRDKNQCNETVSQSNPLFGSTYWGTRSWKRLRLWSCIIFSYIQWCVSIAHNHLNDKPILN